MWEIIFQVILLVRVNFNFKLRFFFSQILLSTNSPMIQHCATGLNYYLYLWILSQYLFLLLCCWKTSKLVVRCVEEQSPSPKGYTLLTCQKPITDIELMEKGSYSLQSKVWGWAATAKFLSFLRSEGCRSLYWWTECVNFCWFVSDAVLFKECMTARWTPVGLGVK